MKCNVLWRLRLPITLLLLFAVGCSQQSMEKRTETDTVAGQGKLTVRANGEDFVRQGFTTKDDWQVSFDHVYVTLADVTASQTDGSESLDASQQVSVPHPVTVDLAAGDESADPVIVAEISDAPSGRYNALAWSLVPAEDGPAVGYPLMLVGTAEKAGEQVNFEIQLDETLTFVCGDFVGDVRKGILEVGQTADVEATFHFDHLFGDGDAPAEEDINTGALGFAPIAQLAQNGEVKVDSDDLKQKLPQEDYQILQTVLPSLGHVGEGHCEAISLEEN